MKNVVLAPTGNEPRRTPCTLSALLRSFRELSLFSWEPFHQSAQRLQSQSHDCWQHPYNIMSIHWLINAMEGVNWCPSRVYIAVSSGAGLSEPEDAFRLLEGRRPPEGRSLPSRSGSRLREIWSRAPSLIGTPVSIGDGWSGREGCWYRWPSDRYGGCLYPTGGNRFPLSAPEGAFSYGGAGGWGGRAVGRGGAARDGDGSTEVNEDQFDQFFDSCVSKNNKVYSRK